MVRVVTDVPAIDKEFDYTVPEAADVAVGDEVRLALGPRRVGGWITAVDPAPGEHTGELKAVSRLRGRGPEPTLVDLAAWAAWRWAGPRSFFLTAASPPRAARTLPSKSLRPPAAPRSGPLKASQLQCGITLVRLPPAADPTPLVAEVAQLGPTLVVVPSVARAEVLAERLARAGGDVALLPDGWHGARAGRAVVVGSRSAAWGPCPDLSAAVVLDAHDESLTAEGAPTWNALDVVAERAARAGAPCVAVTACPTPEVLARAERVVAVERGQELAGWAVTEVVDRRDDDPRLGLWSERLVNLVRSGARVACVLNRKGRVRLLACARCGELARCERCEAAVSSPEPGILCCGRCGQQRPTVCTRCSSTRMKALRVGTSRAREELEHLAGVAVGEVAGDLRPGPERVLVGTEAVLHRITPADRFEAVAFVDFDQELLAPRLRSADEALALLALASRIVRGRNGRIVIQTRLPDHPVVEAARRADPGLATAGQEELRSILRMPPNTAVAVIRGPGGAAYCSGLAEAGLEVLGPDDGRWLVKAASRERLCDALAAIRRPAEPVRVAVDPARL